ncbi:MAG: hypothetical protein AABX07_05650 [Nanoarchaeota archaeon]
MSAQKIVIERNSSREIIDRAYAAMTETYKKLVCEYCLNTHIGISAIIANAGCPNRKVMLDFLNGGNSTPTGIDLERGISYCRLEGRFVDEVSVEISREVMNTQPLMNAPPKEIREEIERRLAILNWFYLATTERALQQAEAR